MASSKSASDLLSKFTLKAKSVVLNLSEVACKAQRATNNEKWGPHGQDMSDIAEGCYDAEKFKEVWEVLKKRIGEGTGDKWRLTYKTLLLIEFLVKQSSQHVVQVVLENSGIIERLQKFEYKDEAGKDWGLNVRNRAKELSKLLADPDRIREERAKAKANKEKYKGISKAEMQQGSGFKTGADAGAVERSGSGLYEDIGLSSRRDSEVQRFTSQRGSMMLPQENNLEEEEEDPVAATSRRVASLKQAGLISSREDAPFQPAAAAATASSASLGAGSRAAPAHAAVPAADSFEAFPAAEPMAGAAKPSLRDLTEAKKGAPKKLGDVRVDPNIAKAFGGMKITPATPPTPTTAAAAPRPILAAGDLMGGLAAPAPTTAPGPTQASNPAADLFAMDAFADFASTAPAPAPVATQHAQFAVTFDDPFAVLSGADRQPAPAPAPAPAPTLDSLASPMKLTTGGNPFSAIPTFNLTATAAAGMPLPEAMFSAPVGPLAGVLCGPGAQASIASPTRTAGVGMGMSSPAMKPGRGLAVGSPVAASAAKAAAVDDPFSAFNPFK